MDSFLKNLEEFHSDFRFIRVKDKILIRLDTKPEVLSNRSMNLADNLPVSRLTIVNFIDFLKPTLVIFANSPVFKESLK